MKYLRRGHIYKIGNLDADLWGVVLSDNRQENVVQMKYFSGAQAAVDWIHQVSLGHPPKWDKHKCSVCESKINE